MGSRIKYVVRVVRTVSSLFLAVGLLGIPTQAVASEPVAAAVDIQTAKEALAVKYADFLAGKLDSATMAAAEWAFTDQTGLATFSPMAPSGYAEGPSGLVAQYEAIVLSKVPDGGGGARVLPVQQQPQTKNYYCGPATAVEILQALGHATSTYNQALTQTELARSWWLYTDYYGGTPWFGHPAWSCSDAGNYACYVMRNTLNHWRTGSNDGYYVPRRAPDDSTYTQDLVFDIDRGWPIAGDMYQPANNSTLHLNGHPWDRSLKHWIALAGYRGTGGTETYYADSASSEAVSYGGAVPPYSFYASSRIAAMERAWPFGHIW
ncbi:MAG: hypothetical protein WDA71_04980 [Actinomycetota bacterium]